MDSLMSHTATSPDPAVLGEDGTGVVWVPWGPACRPAVPAQGAGEQVPLQAGSSASPRPRPLPCGCTKAGRSTLCPPQSFSAPFPAWPGVLKLAWPLRWDLRAGCLLALLGDHPKLSILLGGRTCVPSPTPLGDPNFPSLAPHPQG